ncbi:hypothetical protein Tco_0676973 [Tanacetum coccineum]
MAGSLPKLQSQLSWICYVADKEGKLKIKAVELILIKFERLTYAFACFDTRSLLPLYTFAKDNADVPMDCYVDDQRYRYVFNKGKSGVMGTKDNETIVDDVQMENASNQDDGKVVDNVVSNHGKAVDNVVSNLLQP